MGFRGGPGRAPDFWSRCEARIVGIAWVYNWTRAAALMGGNASRSCAPEIFRHVFQGRWGYIGARKGAPQSRPSGFVGRGGARERTQFSPQAETELSGLCDDKMVGGRWKPTRIEYAADWYLVGIRADDLNGLRVRI